MTARKRTAQELYEHIFETLGYGDKQLREISYSSLESVAAEVEDCLSDTGVDLSANPLKLPSAYHAALYLTWDQVKRAFADGLSDIDYFKHVLGYGLDESKLVAESVIFRGQSDCCRPPRAGIYRDGVNVPKALLEQELFCAMLQHAVSYAFQFTLEDADCLALAQHYGLTTHLLDFTVDPSIAVQFAATGKPPRGHETCDAVAYRIESRKWGSSRVNIVLPPPIGERLYLQRGLFIVIGKEDIVALRNACREVHFPRCPDFQIYRDSVGFDTLPDEPLLRDIADWARRTSVTQFSLPNNPSQQRFVLEPQYANLPNKDSLTRAKAEDLAENWLIRSTDMLHRLFSVPEPRDPEGERIFAGLYPLAARHNQRLLRSLAINARQIADQIQATDFNQAQSQLAFAQILEAALMD